MKVLSIGNSFSQDAQRYLHQIAKADGVDIYAVNLYIPGCSLYTHYQNVLSGEKAYSLEINGEYTGKMVSLKEALTSCEWEVITLQQVSDQSPNYNTFQPYLKELAEYVRKIVPKAKIVIHQIWAYEQGCYRLEAELGYTDAKDMLSDIVSSYDKAARDIKADYIIPSGELLGSLLQNGIKSVHRDTFHASLGIGRYALGLLWYSILTENEVLKNSFNQFDEPILQEDVATVKRCVSEMKKKVI